MTYSTVKNNEERESEILDFYTEFMIKQKSKRQAFTSLDEFKKTDAYKEHTEEQQEELEKNKDEKVIILIFENADQAIEYIEQAKAKGLYSEKQAEAAIAEIKEQDEENSHRPGM